MACQICGKKAGYYPLCKDCNKLKEEGKISKCVDCGKWNKNPGDRCYECWIIFKNEQDKKSKDYKASSGETEEHDFRAKFPANIRTKLECKTWDTRRVQKYLGHEQSSTTDTYIEFAEEYYRQEPKDWFLHALRKH